MQSRIDRIIKKPCFEGVIFQFVGTIWHCKLRSMNAAPSNSRISRTCTEFDSLFMLLEKVRSLKILVKKFKSYYYMAAGPWQCQSVRRRRTFDAIQSGRQTFVANLCRKLKTRSTPTTFWVHLPAHQISSSSQPPIQKLVIRSVPWTFGAVPVCTFSEPGLTISPPNFIFQRSLAQKLVIRSTQSNFFLWPPIQLPAIRSTIKYFGADPLCSLSDQRRNKSACINHVQTTAALKPRKSKQKPAFAVVACQECMDLMQGLLWVCSVYPSWSKTPWQIYPSETICPLA